nr:MAG TPA: hypothetical protein [Bacteriophage sp.]
MTGGRSSVVSNNTFSETDFVRFKSSPTYIPRNRLKPCNYIAVKTLSAVIRRYRDCNSR